MWSRVYDNILYAMAYMDFAAHPRLPVAGFHSTERYGSYSDCNGTRYLSTRILPLQWTSQGMAESRSMFHFALRASDSNVGVVHQVAKHRMAHNLVLTCIGGALHAYGGTDTQNTFKELMGDHDGVYLARVKLEDGSLVDARKVLDGHHPGCVEKRIKFGGVCEFDGKFAVVEEWKGRKLFYARANTVSYHGGRHVQVAASDDGGLTWGDFRLLNIDGVAHGEPDNNIYYFTADAWNKTHLVGSFPAVLEDGRSGVFVSYSQDGVAWSRPQMVVEAQAFGQRVELFPVGVRGKAVHVMHVNLLNDPTRSAHGVELYAYPILGEDSVAKAARERTRVRAFDVDALRLVN